MTERFRDMFRHREIGKDKVMVQELYKKAQKFFERDKKAEVPMYAKEIEAAVYVFNQEDYKMISNELEQLDFGKSLINSIGTPIFFIFPNTMKILEVEGKPIFLPLPKDIPDEYLEKINIEIEGPSKRLPIEIGEIKSLTLSLDIEIIPNEKTTISQHKKLELAITSLGDCIFTARDFKITDTENKETYNVTSDSKTKLEPTDKEIKFFQSILSKNLQKIEPQ